jgi:hypothetical protein
MKARLKLGDALMIVTDSKAVVYSKYNTVLHFMDPFIKSGKLK